MFSKMFNHMIRHKEQEGKRLVTPKLWMKFPVAGCNCSALERNKLDAKPPREPRFIQAMKIRI